MAWFTRQSVERLTNERESVINKWYDDVGNDAHIYIIYKDGSQCIASGVEILAGDITPKMQDIAYAQYQDGWERFDTLIGCFEKAFPYSSDFTDEEENEYIEKTVTIYFFQISSRHISCMR